MFKYCKSCDKYRSIIEFHKNNRNSDGLHSYCKECVRDKDKLRYNQNSSKIKSQSKLYREANLNYYYEKKKLWQKNNKSKVQEYTKKQRLGSIARAYKITVDEVLELYSRGCEICGIKEGKLCIDHCHETGKVRGCLCARCNNALGYYEYLKRNTLLNQVEGYLIRSN